MRQYSIDQVELTWQGLNFKPGLAQGTTVTEARNAPSFTVKPTGQGKAVRVYNPDRTGTVAVIVDQESQLHQSLRSRFKTRSLLPNPTKRGGLNRPRSRGSSPSKTSKKTPPN
jgi:hypothetical protein